ncbi:MAG: type II toxin-antitoxin system Phd/YefM family antitoxin [Actinomycetota bacterium]|nr:type II toxin-antitoxin system Phd/YefM family antitoxin [Actinomycetota bacterium]
MREISATDAARRFAEMLDAVEHEGESFLVRRNGRAVARIEPAAGATGRSVKDLLANAPRDPDWIHDLETLRTGLPAEVTPWDA